jgi:hypothetical protein
MDSEAPCKERFHCALLKIFAPVSSTMHSQAEEREHFEEKPAKALKKEESSDGLREPL